MIRSRQLLSSLLLATTLGVLALPGHAEMPCGEEGPRHHAKEMEQHHNKLHAALKLAPEQEAAWKKLMDSEPAMSMGKPGKPEDCSKLTTPERMDKMQENMKQHQTKMSEHVAMLKEFYAVLTPAQQKIFDDFHKGHHDGKHAHHHAGAASAKP